MRILGKNGVGQILKTNKAKEIRFSTLEKICEALVCKPGDILDYEGNK